MFEFIANIMMLLLFGIGIAFLGLMVYRAYWTTLEEHRKLYPKPPKRVTDVYQDYLNNLKRSTKIRMDLNRSKKLIPPENVDNGQPWEYRKGYMDALDYATYIIYKYDGEEGKRIIS